MPLLRFPVSHKLVMRITRYCLFFADKDNNFFLYAK
jgi:hypothetical protein